MRSLQQLLVVCIITTISAQREHDVLRLLLLPRQRQRLRLRRQTQTKVKAKQGFQKNAKSGNHIKSDKKSICKCHNQGNDYGNQKRLNKFKQHCQKCNKLGHMHFDFPKPDVVSKWVEVELLATRTMVRSNFESKNKITSINSHLAKHFSCKANSSMRSIQWTLELELVQ